MDRWIKNTKENDEMKTKTKYFLKQERVLTIEFPSRQYDASTCEIFPYSSQNKNLKKNTLQVLESFFLSLLLASLLI